MIRKFTLLLLNLACYAYFTQWNVVYFLFLASAIVCSNHINNATIKKIFAVVTIVSLIAGFLLFKSTTIKGNIILGYSVFAFCGISFIIDQYKTRRKYDVIDILLYLFFFPKMLAGPIIQAEYFIGQLSQNAMSKRRFYQGVKLLIYACFLKFIVADIVLSIDDMTGIGINLFIQTIIWGIRFYLDFYAYSLIAVGLGLLVGIRLPYNFDNPYSALTFRDLWHRWNITLSQWLSRYIYVPLGGSKCSKTNTCLNIVTTFVISGLWHGINLPFVLWGFCHGILVCLERIYFGYSKKVQSKWLYRLFVVFSTIFLWQLFRLTDLKQVSDFATQLCTLATIDRTIFIYGLSACLLLYAIESPIVKCLILGNEDSRSYIIYEVSILSVMLAVLMLCPLHYTFNFFYLKY